MSVTTRSYLTVHGVFLHAVYCISLISPHSNMLLKRNEEKSNMSSYRKRYRDLKKPSNRAAVVYHCLLKSPCKLNFTALLFAARCPLFLLFSLLFLPSSSFNLNFLTLMPAFISLVEVLCFLLLLLKPAMQISLGLSQLRVSRNKREAREIYAGNPGKSHRQYLQIFFR